jgi:hypothetical protein
MPRPFQIVRVAKQQWAVQPVEKGILSTQIPDAIDKDLKKIETKLNHSLQACDWSELSPIHQVTAWMIALQYRTLQGMATMAIRGMQEIYGRLGNGDGEDEPSTEPPALTTSTEEMAGSGSP